jgi:hypothetical protein
MTITILGAVLLVVGVALGVLSPDREVETGWFAYAPGSEAVFNPPTSRESAPGRSWGIGLAAFGVVLLSGVFGYRIGRRDGVTAGAEPAA